MKTVISMFMLAGLLTFVGCSKAPETSESQPPATGEAAPAAVDGSKFLIGDAPEGSQDVIAVRESAKDGDDVTIVGRIGGSENPWIEGRASFTIVDNSLKACSDIPGDECPTPWDYCCATDQLPTSTALVKVVDENGDPVKVDARELLNVKELSTVVVKGKASRDESGNLTVLATGVYVKK